MIDDIKQSLKEAFDELNELSTETKKLRASSAPKSRPLEKGKSTSSWALSSTPRTIYATSKDDSSGLTSDVNDAHIKKPASHGFTIAKSSRHSPHNSASSNTDIPFYDTNINALSTKKRVKGIEFSTASNNVKKVSVQSSDEVTTTSVPVPYNSEAREPKVTKVYSFGKSEKSKKTDADHPTTILDVDRAYNWLNEKQPTAIFSKSKSDRMCNNTCTNGTALIAMTENDNNQDKIVISESKDTNIELLSNRNRSIAVKFAPESTSSATTRRKRDMSDFGTPGPGAYTDTIEKLSSIGHKYRSDNSNDDSDITNTQSKDKSVGKNLSEKVREIYKHSKSSIPGPGAYDIEISDKHTRTNTAPEYKSLFHNSENKITPQLQRKRYWEEKVKDVRDFHDNMNDSNIDVVMKRQPVATITPDVKKGVNHRNRAYIAKLNAEKAMVSRIGYYDLQYDQTDKKVHVSVAMEKEVQSTKKTKEMLDSAGIVTAAQRREQERIQRDSRYLGPQLQAPWGKDVLDRDLQRDNVDSDRSDSPTEELNRLLSKKDRERRKHESFGFMAPIGRQSRIEDDTHTEAFLRSSFAGINNTPGVVLRPPTKNDNRHVVDRELTEEERSMQYLSTQVHKDWGELINENKYKNAVKMDGMHGREEIIIHAKGIIEKREFNDGLDYVTEGPGPGLYDPDSQIRFGVNVKSGVAFGDAISRDDIVGPNGEKPRETLVGKGNRNDFYDDIMQDEELDLDMIKAKEKNMKRVQGVELYKKDRFREEKEKEEAFHHLGGSYFQGMVSEVNKQPYSVKYDNMSGRVNEEEEIAVLGSLLDAEVDGNIVDVQVKNWKPNEERVLTAAAWKVNEKVPRFEPVKEDPYKVTLSPKVSFVKPRELAVVDMNRQSSRWHDEKMDDDRIVDDELYGDMNVNRMNDAAIGLAKDQSLKNADNAQSNRQRTRDTNFGKQLQRNIDLRNKTDAPDVDYNVDISAYDVERRDKGTLGWDQQIGRDAMVITKEKVNDNIDNPFYNDEEEVMISPKIDNSSKVKRTITAPAWSKQQHVPNRPDLVKPLGADLDYADAHTSEFGIAKGVGMSQQQGRRDNLTLQDINDEHGHVEELIISPDYNILRREKGQGAARGGVEWKKQKDSLYYDNKQYSNDSPADGEVLDLDAKNIGKEKNPSKGVDFGGKRDKKYLEDPSMVKKEKEELILDPHLSGLNKIQNPVVSWSKQHDSQMDRESMLSGIESEKLNLSPKKQESDKTKTFVSWERQSGDKAMNRSSVLSRGEELKLSPSAINRDPNKTSFNVSWEKQNNINDSASSLITKEELILSPKPIGLKSKVEYSMKRHDPAMDRGSLLSATDAPHELILSPKDITGNRKGHNTSFRRQGQDIERDGDGNFQFEDEELILSPKEIRGDKKSQFTSWQKQSFVDRDSLMSKGEELILEPKRVEKTNNTVKWANIEPELTPPNVTVPRPISKAPPSKSRDVKGKQVVESKKNQDSSMNSKEKGKTKSTIAKSGIEKKMRNMKL